MTLVTPPVVTAKREDANETASSEIAYPAYPSRPALKAVDGRHVLGKTALSKQVRGFSNDSRVSLTAQKKHKIKSVRSVDTRQSLPRKMVSSFYQQKMHNVNYQSQGPKLSYDCPFTPSKVYQSQQALTEPKKEPSKFSEQNST
jgi:hypothetical protein